MFFYVRTSTFRPTWRSLSSVVINSAKFFAKELIQVRSAKVTPQKKLVKYQSLNLAIKS